MALLIKPSDIVFNEPGTKLLFTDITGAYDAVANLTGFGVPNPARASLALFFVAVYNRLSGPETLIMDAYDPLATGVEYKINLKDDGWVTLHALGFNSVAAPVAGNYSAGSVVYDSTSGKLQKIVGGAWVVITDILAEQSKSIGYNKVEHFPTPKQYKKLNDINKQEIDISFDLTPDTACEHKGLLALKDQYYLLETRLAATHYVFLQGNRTVAQRNIEFLNKRL